MSLLDVGARCAACSLVDFLPFTCPGCSQVFCREHVQGHDCASQPQAEAEAGPSRKRLRGTCAYGECKEEEGIAREVRCTCGGAFCIK
jgi:hypothetical protein